MRTSETVGNITTAAVALALLTAGGLAVDQVLRLQPVDTSTQPESRPTPLVAGSDIPALDRGELGTVRTVVLVLSTRCVFCDRSFGFYRDIASSTVMDGIRGRLLVLGTGGDAHMRAYLEDRGLAAHAVFSLRRVPIPEVRATPTLIVLDGAGAVIEAWSGQLTPDLEHEVWLLLNAD